MFTQLSLRDMEQHVPILGWVYIISNAFMALLGGFLLFFLTGIGVISGEAEAVAVLTLVGMFVSGVLVVLALPGMIAGYGLLRRKEWGRILAIIIGILNLINFPIGTVIGVYALWVLFQESALTYFEGSPVTPRTSPPAAAA
jgi:voltage-gated potassium channel Kch